MSWRDFLNDLETNPDLDPGQRHQLANAIRDDVEAMERAIGTATKAGADVAKAVVEAQGEPGKRARSVLAWQRGSSFSIRVDGPEDVSWLEDIQGEPPPRLYLIPEPASAARIEENEQTAWAKGVRVTVHLPKKDGSGPEDAWQLRKPRGRNLGGHTGRALIATFSFEQLIGPEREDGGDE